MNQKATLEVITGPMYSGKTEELIRRLKRVSLAGQKAVVLRPSLDCKRYKNVETHDGSLELIKATGFHPIVVPTALEDIWDELTSVLGVVMEADVVAIEEAQFFKEAIVVFVAWLLKNTNKKIICAGLDLDCLGKPYGFMPELFALANSITKLTAICVNCKDTATRTFAKVKIDGDVSEAIGGHDMYEARCITCWHQTQ